MDKESDSRNDVEGKTMAKWIDYNEDEQRALIANAASARHIRDCVARQGSFSPVC